MKVLFLILSISLLMFASQADASKKPYLVQVTACETLESSIGEAVCLLTRFETVEGSDIRRKAKGTNTPNVFVFMSTGSETKQFTVTGLNCPEEPSVGRLTTKVRYTKGLLKNSIKITVSCMAAKTDDSTATNTTKDSDENNDYRDECENARDRATRHVCWGDGWRRRGRK